VKWLERLEIKYLKALEKKCSLKKICRFCADKVSSLNFYDIKSLKPLISERGKIIPSRISGNCAKHQRAVTTAIKRARCIALLPFSEAH